MGRVDHILDAVESKVVREKELVLVRLEVVDEVLAGVGIENELVLAASSVQVVIPGAAVDLVVGAFPLDRIVAAFAESVSLWLVPTRV